MLVDTFSTMNAEPPLEADVLLTDPQNGLCLYCSKRIATATRVVDHFVPWSRYSADLAQNLGPRRSKMQSAEAGSDTPLSLTWQSLGSQKPRRQLLLAIRNGSVQLRNVLSKRRSPRPARPTTKSASEAGSETVSGVSTGAAIPPMTLRNLPSPMEPILVARLV
jgi:hypothetical protein